MKKPAVSIVMAEYNTNEAYLRKAIASILNQTFNDFEFIIVDDGTKNPLEAIVASFNDKRMRIIKNPSNKGLIYSLNNGIQHSRAEYIVRMDTDDRALPDRIERIYSFITSHPEYDVVGSRALEFSAEDGRSGILGRAGEKTKRAIMRGDVPVHPTVIFRRDAIVDAGMYDTYYRAEDFALWCKLLLRGNRLFVIDDILLEYRVNLSDYKKRILKNRHGELKARLYYYPKLGAKPIDYLFILKSVVAGFLPSRIVNSYHKKFILAKD